MNNRTVFSTLSLTTTENPTRGYNDTIRYFTPRALTPVHIACIFIIVTGITINSVVIYLFLTKRYLQNSLSNIFLFSLAISDLCYCAMAIPSYIHCDTTYLKSSCNAYEILLVIFNYSTVYHILIAITEKLFAICFTMKHRSLFTRSLAIKLSVSVWSVALLIGLLPLTWRDNGWPNEEFYAFNFATAFVAPAIISAVMYAAMIYKLSKQFSRMSSFRASQRNENKKRLRNERKAVLVFAVMFSAFLLCWGGWGYARFHPIQNKQLNIVFNIAKYLDPIINPLVHTFVKRDFHRALGINKKHATREKHATRGKPNSTQPSHPSQNESKKMLDVNEHVTSL